MTPIASTRGSFQALPGDAVGLSSSAGRNARVPFSSSTAATRLSSPRWIGCGTERAATGTPSAAPAIDPSDQAAWKRGMIARPSRRSTSAPSTFIATSQMLVPIP